MNRFDHFILINWPTFVNPSSSLKMKCGLYFRTCWASNYRIVSIDVSGFNSSRVALNSLNVERVAKSCQVESQYGRLLKTTDVVD